MSRFWCEHAHLGGSTVTSGVLVETNGGTIGSVTSGVAPPPDATRLSGITVAGMASAHSHAFHRALRGRAQGRGSFWRWRDEMYALADALTPDTYYRLAAAVFAEMLERGVTVVGEFHYLHHQVGGTPYDAPNIMGEALVHAATEVGIRLTLLDTAYFHGGFEPDGTRLPPTGPQLRFCDPSPDAWATRVDQLAGGEVWRLGAAVHSVRAVDEAGLRVAVEWADAAARPLHCHVSEQPAENEQARAATGCSPMRLLADAGAISDRFTAVHATHVTAEDMALLGAADGFACFCPTTERDLGDGIGPSADLRDHGVRLTLGSDSNAVIHPLGEALALEQNERLAQGRRGLHAGPELLQMLQGNGYTSLGWSHGGAIEVGAIADLVTFRTDRVELAGWSPSTAVDQLIFAASPRDIDHVVVAGKAVVRDGCHATVDTARALRAVLAELGASG